VNSAQADKANNGHLDEGPGGPDLAPLGEEPTPASQQAGTNANVDQCDNIGASSPGTMDLNKARDIGRGLGTSNENNVGAGLEASSTTIPTVTVDLTNAPSPLPPVANTGFGHAATAEQLFATSDPSAALSDLSELSQHQDHDASFLVPFNESFPQTVYEMPNEAWFESILSSLPPLPPMAQGPTGALHPQFVPDSFGGPTMTGELQFLEQGAQPDATVQELPLPNAGTLLFLPDALAHSEEENDPVGSLVKVAGQAERGKKRKGKRSKVDDGPGSNQDSASATGREKRTKKGNEGDTVVTADAVSMGAAVTETRSRRTSNLPAHLREAGYSAPKRGKRVKKD
jgi:hypothetical protein